MVSTRTDNDGTFTFSIEDLRERIAVLDAETTALRGLLARIKEMGGEEVSIPLDQLDTWKVRVYARHVPPAANVQQGPI